MQSCSKPGHSNVHANKHPVVLSEGSGGTMKSISCSLFYSFTACDYSQIPLSFFNRLRRMQMIFLIVHEMSLNFSFTLRVHSFNQLFGPFQTNLGVCIVSFIFFFSLIENATSK